jgi:hypothetical protein
LSETHWPQISDSLKRIADTIATELRTAKNSAVLRDLLDIHAEAIRLASAIDEGIDVSLEQVENLIIRYAQVKKG